MLIFSTSMDLINETKRFLAYNFDMKDMSEASVVLRIKIIKTNDGLMLSQEHYVEIFLRKCGFQECKPVSTPYDANSQLKKNKEHSVKQSEYAQIIGSLYVLNEQYQV